MGRRGSTKNPRYKSPPHPVGMAEQAVRSAGFHSIKYEGKRNTKAGPLQVFTGTSYQDGKTYLLGVGRPYGDAVSVRVLAAKKKPHKGPKQLKLFKNPRGSDIYDPREEQLRAQRQAIYETSLLRDEPQLKFKSFRNSKGERLDKVITEEGDLPWLRKYIGKKMFQIGVGVQKRDLGVRRKDGYLVPTNSTITKSQSRYSDVDKLVRNRQDYEESLALMRKSSFYRVTKEPTRDGWMYFVWPLQPGQRIPKGFKDKKRAENVVNLANRDAPTVGGAWWKPPKKKYTKRELGHWLPPASIWRR